MLETSKTDDGIFEISHEGHFSEADWKAYQALMLEILDAAEGKICILSNFSKSVSFDTHLVKEVGTAKHLGHPNLGFLILLGGNSLHNFVFSLTESRATHENKAIKMKIERDHERALDTLRHFQAQFKRETEYMNKNP